MTVEFERDRASRILLDSSRLGGGVRVHASDTLQELLSWLEV